MFEFEKGCLLADRIIVTGCAGFTGSAVVRNITQRTERYDCMIDKMTCAGMKIADTKLRLTGSSQTIMPCTVRKYPLSHWQNAWIESPETEFLCKNGENEKC